MKIFLALIALFVFSISGQCAGKAAPKKTIKMSETKATKAKKPVKGVGPLFGLYEVKVFNKEWVLHRENDYGTDLYQLEHDFKWLRLYKNGTYKTNLSKTGKPEGRFSYNRKKQEITFYEFHPKQKNREHLIDHKEPADYGNSLVYGMPGFAISWHHEHYTAVHGGYVECKWVKP
ncbi:MAG TPA: hypothetical protein VGB77_03160 [Abditibacteriaceae bacterium]|jgi:hypothetical protein